MSTEATAPISVPQHVLDYLGEHQKLTLATASTTGVPHAATFLFVNDGPQLFFWTRPETTTAKQVAQNPVVAFTVDDYAEDWSKTKGVQGTGECRVLLNASDIIDVARTFAEKFPNAQSSGKTTNISFFRITPTQLQFIDNTEGGRSSDDEFGLDFKREVVYSVFTGLPRQEALGFTGELQPVNVAEGEIIVRQGAPADKIFIIIKGEVGIEREEPDGSTVELDTLRDGQFFGEVAILRDTPREATAKALTDVTLLALQRDTFQKLVAGSLGTTGDFDSVIKQRLEQGGGV
ncbi:MAG TPA: cyclic nucleotide-binding domain-containing protein [Gaiellaceae bacterium]|nr:cyclic nucleotide-binding domain-containing protein [Gaiellaceae bacterium]